MTDYEHVSGFKEQAQILQQLILAIERPGLIDAQTRLHDANGNQHNFESNKFFVQTMLLTSLL
jgi:hypothetical protein